MLVVRRQPRHVFRITGSLGQSPVLRGTSRRVSLRLKASMDARLREIGSKSNDHSRFPPNLRMHRSAVLAASDHVALCRAR